MASVNANEPRPETNSLSPQLWLRRSNRDGLVLVERSSPRFEDDHEDNAIQESTRQNLKRIFRRTTSYISRPKPRRGSDLLGPLTYNQSFLCRSFHEGQQGHQGPRWDHDYLRRLYTKFENGICLTKVTRKKQVDYVFYVKSGILHWRDAKSIDLDSIKDVRTGEMAKNYIDDYRASPSAARFWVTIIYQVATKFRPLHLVAHNQEDYECLYVGIVSIVDSRHNLMRSLSNPEDEMFANVHWRANVPDEKAANDVDVLSFQDVKDLCAKFNIFCSSSHLRKLFDAADINCNELLSFTEFQSFVQRLKRREELLRLWHKITKGKDELQYEDFLEFLTNEQHEVQDLRKSVIDFDRFRLSNNTLSLEGFQKYLTAQPYLEDNITDYSLPINKYFISSSHNTYLQGKQLGESPTVEAYVHALQQGCRCIEIDIWDGEEGPVVCHGKLTGSLPLRNIIKVVRKYSFITSPYPLVISLEIHCKLENQIAIETILHKELGDKIYVGTQNDVLPSPAELKHRYLLKVKKSKRMTRTSQDEDSISSSSTSSSYDSEFESSNKRGRRLSISKKMHVVDSLVSISVVHGLKFRNFSLPESKTLNHCFSLNEKKLENLIKKDETQKLAIGKHNRRFLMRVYPHALRYKSSNFNPIKFWELGAQMVATNWQTYDLGQQLNKAMFQLPLDEGPLWHSGYVLKPDYMLNDVNKASDIQATYVALRKKKIVVKVEVLSAQMLPRPKDLKQKQSALSFGVRLNVYGTRILRPLEVMNGIVNSETSGSTHGCRDNGFSPIWETKFKIILEDNFFNFLQFKVRTGDLELASCCLKLGYLRRGFRHVPLYSDSGERYIFSTLFIRIQYDYIE
ncbi:LANO_0A07162g1_1 [Lachancea nothofagi CBS 11611]|uniref:Phosphoinositide phospholipase C n=1 Tax=Lachancea nothofagi CBS 11611 TaxID=1266666 RepID=A0A1G4IS98_9SACH|nr:LANO_0A07162g1_1 [Lachancea nothofagi CBS 11611]